MSSIGDHFFAVRRRDQTFYRDHERETVGDREFYRILNQKALPEGFYAYHYFGVDQWTLLLTFPIVPGELCIRMQVEILNSVYGRMCRRCRMQPAEGLWQGRFPIVNHMTDILIRTSPYKGYICEQCAQHLEEETRYKEQWLSI